MRFLVISHALHKISDTKVYSYAPYVREMNLWFKYVDEVIIIAPKIDDNLNNIDLNYEHKNLKLRETTAIKFTNAVSSFTSIIKLPFIMVSIFMECYKADHIHLRCPGNIGLLGCLVQMFFPSKSKTAKYAGNWDSKSKQPLSYRFQKWVLSNTFLTRNIKVLIYGKWNNQSNNIKPFFTATYYKSEIEKPLKRDYSEGLNFVFVGSLVEGKQPFFAIQVIEELYKRKKNVNLDIFGEGILKDSLVDYIQNNDLENIIKFHGNQSKEIIKESYKEAHFSILPSKSEGWPKAIAEAMFFGVIPISTEVSCIPYMLDFGNRGVLIKPKLEKALYQINDYLEDEKRLKEMSMAALNWSQNYTLDVFEKEISNLLN